MCEVQMRPARVSAPMAIHPLLQPSRPSACRGVPRELARVRPPRGGQRPRDGLSPCRPYNSPCQGPGPRGGHFLFLGDRMSVRQPRMQHAHVSRRRALSATLPAGPTPQIPPNNARKFSKLQASVLEGIHPLGRCGGRRHQHGRVRRRAEGHLVGVCGLGGGGGVMRVAGRAAQAPLTRGGGQQAWRRAPEWFWAGHCLGIRRDSCLEAC